jgi:hypothetical protein
MGPIVKLDVDGDLLARAIGVVGKGAVRDGIERVLRDLVRLAPPDEAQFARQREALENLYGIGWEGDLDAMREWR